eukprot:NODE_6390_length_641_cov_64.754864_g6367_i0.p1 GENE.NODE_6390_length_641_cov_64.754864_g6367_i0~~NODE_6390_length_641_cov_64.754864_g6367_i0.p1  ORF type:complete len:140 (+),score=15.89 NODE_6390_length_641_cov_64.754864_g6367_i0:72-491(+)
MGCMAGKPVVGDDYVEIVMEYGQLKMQPNSAEALGVSQHLWTGITEQFKATFGHRVSDEVGGWCADPKQHQAELLISSLQKQYAPYELRFYYNSRWNQWSIPKRWVHELKIKRTSAERSEKKLVSPPSLIPVVPRSPSP